MRPIAATYSPEWATEWLLHLRPAADAVSSAVAIKQALAEVDWGTTPLKARIGLHTAEAVVDDNGYASRPINRCARLMAAAHGGQVLVSGTTEALVRYELSDGLSLIDLGEHRLRDLGNPMHVFQITSPGDDPFPPLRSVEALPPSVPIQAASSTNRTSGRSSRRVPALVGVLVLGAAGALGVGNCGAARITAVPGLRVRRRWLR